MGVGAAAEPVVAVGVLGPCGGDVQFVGASVDVGVQFHLAGFCRADGEFLFIPVAHVGRTVAEFARVDVVYLGFGCGEGLQVGAFGVLGIEGVVSGVALPVDQGGGDASHALLVLAYPALDGFELRAARVGQGLRRHGPVVVDQTERAPLAGRDLHELPVIRAHDVDPVRGFVVRIAEHPPVGGHGEGLAAQGQGLTVVDVVVMDLTVPGGVVRQAAQGHLAELADRIAGVKRRIPLHCPCHWHDASLTRMPDSTECSGGKRGRSAATTPRPHGVIGGLVPAAGAPPGAG